LLLWKPRFSFKNIGAFLFSVTAFEIHKCLSLVLLLNKHMKALKVKVVAFEGAPESLYDQGLQKLKAALPAHDIQYSEDEYDLLYLISGGSEQKAIKLLHKGLPNYIVAFRENNAWAAASEVKAWAVNHRFQLRLTRLEDLPHQADLIDNMVGVRRALKQLNGKRLGLIGEVSDWLVASTVSPERLKQVMGIELVRLAYDDLPDYLSFNADPEFLAAFPTLRSQHNELSSVYQFLKNTIHEHSLDAITIQCFRMVREKSVTACLPLSLLTARGILSGCEGDIVSIASMMLLKELTGETPWMANLVAVESDHVLFAHCTAPLQLAKEVTIDSHYETGLSAAVKAELDLNEVTIFRMNEALDRVFVAEGMVKASPAYDWACRTQIEVACSAHDLLLLKEHPLGNHHLIIAGNHKRLITEYVKTLGELHH